MRIALFAYLTGLVVIVATRLGSKGTVQPKDLIDAISWPFTLFVILAIGALDVYQDIRDHYMKGRRP